MHIIRRNKPQIDYSKVICKLYRMHSVANVYKLCYAINVAVQYQIWNSNYMIVNVDYSKKIGIDLIMQSNTHSYLTSCATESLIRWTAIIIQIVWWYTGNYKMVGLSINFLIIVWKKNSGKMFFNVGVLSR